MIEAEALLTKSQQKGSADLRDSVPAGRVGLAARRIGRRRPQQLQRCLELNPNFDNAMTGLARALAKLGREDEAKSWLHKALAEQSAELPGVVSERAAGSGKRSGGGASCVRESGCASSRIFPPGSANWECFLFEQKNYAGRGAASGESDRTGAGRCATAQFSRNLLQPHESNGQGGARVSAGHCSLIRNWPRLT